MTTSKIHIKWATDRRAGGGSCCRVHVRSKLFNCSERKQKKKKKKNDTKWQPLIFSLQNWQTIDTWELLQRRFTSETFSIFKNIKNGNNSFCAKQKRKKRKHTHTHVHVHMCDPVSFFVYATSSVGWASRALGVHFLVKVAATIRRGWGDADDACVYRKIKKKRELFLSFFFKRVERESESFFFSFFFQTDKNEREKNRKRHTRPYGAVFLDHAIT